MTQKGRRPSHASPAANVTACCSAMPTSKVRSWNLLTSRRRCHRHPLYKMLVTEHSCLHSAANGNQHVCFRFRATSTRLLRAAASTDCCNAPQITQRQDCSATGMHIISSCRAGALTPGRRRPRAGAPCVKAVEAGATTHGCMDADDARVALRLRDQRVRKHVCV